MRLVRPQLFIFLAAFAIRLALAGAFVGLGAPPKGDANPDQLDYESLAYHLSAGDGFVVEAGIPTACRPPGTAFLLAPVYAVFGHSYLAGRIWLCLLSAGCCPVVGWIATRLLDRRAGWLAAGWLAVYPGHAYYAMHFLSEAPTTFLTAVALAFQLRAVRQPTGRFDLVAGLAWGLGILTRPNLAIAAGLCGLLAVTTGGLTWRTRTHKALLMGLAMAVVVLPWVIRNANVVGKPGICTIVGGYTFWGAHNPTVANDPELVGYWVATSRLVDADHPLPGDEVEREARAWEYGKAFIAGNLADTVRLKLHALGRTVWAYSEGSNRLADAAFRLGWILSLPFVAVGIFRLLRARRLEALYLLTPIAAVFATAILFYGCGRFRDAAAPAFAVFVAASICRVRNADSSK